MNPMRWIILSVLLVGLAACQAAPAPAPNALPQPPTAAPAPSATALPASPLPPTAAVEASPTATPDETQPAIAAAQAYFNALQADDYVAASGWISRFSLLPDSLTPADAAAELQAHLADGQRWQDVQVVGAQVFDAKTVLVHVTYTLVSHDVKTGKDTTQAVDEQWPVRREVSDWRVNRDKLIDYHSLDIPAHTTAGLTLQPKLLLRYTDRMRLVFLAQNGTNEAIVLGQPAEVLAAFNFGDQKVEAQSQRLVFDRLRSYTDAAIEIKGLFSAYPDSVEIRRWKAYSEPPWFTFSFSE
jgi:hypothetical protein